MNRFALITFASVPTLLFGSIGSADAQKTLSDGITDLATQISSGVTHQQKTKVAIIPFRELDGRATVLGTYLSEALVTELFRRGGLEIVERTMLDRILGELKLNESGLIDPGTAKRVGQVAGVEAIVTGTITDLQSFAAINCRLIDVQSGRVFAVAETKIVKDDDVKRIMGVQMGAAFPPSSSGPLGRPTAPGSRGDAARPIWNDRALKLEVLSIARSKDETKVIILLSNLTTEDMRVTFQAANYGGNKDPARWQTYIVDDLGNKHGLVAASVFTSNDDGWGQVPLLPSTPIRVQLAFDGPSAEASAITLIIVNAYGGGWTTAVTVRLGPMRLGAGEG